MGAARAALITFRATGIGRLPALAPLRACSFRPTNGRFVHRKIFVILNVAALAAIAPIANAAGPDPARATGEEIVRAMHDRYAGRSTNVRDSGVDGFLLKLCSWPTGGSPW